MSSVVLYQQINKDHAFWAEKRRRNSEHGGNTAGLLTHLVDGAAVTNVLFDAGLGTIDGLCDLTRFDWTWPLDVVLTHAHADHHAELQILSEQWCKRYGPRRAAIHVRASAVTLGQVSQSHARGFGDGQTLTAVPLVPGVTDRLGIFSITGIAVDHLPGAMIYVVEFGREKIVIGWDMKSLPRVADHPRLARPSLAFVDSNTWSALSSRTGHSSVEDLVASGFLHDLRVHEAPATRCGTYLVHYSGAEDPGGPLSDRALALKFRREYPDLASWVDVASRGQCWTFAVEPIHPLTASQVLRSGLER
jgi:hypothetical protein